MSVLQTDNEDLQAGQIMDIGRVTGRAGLGQPWQMGN